MPPFNGNGAGGTPADAAPVPKRIEESRMTEHSAARVRAALLDPAAVFASPAEVERDPALSHAEKLAILEHWEEDAREFAAAREAGAARPDPARMRVRRFVRPVREIVHADHEIDEAALRLSLQEHPILPVADGDEIVGVLTPADLARAAKEANPEAKITARVIMTTHLAFCYLDDDVATGRAMTDRHGSDHLLVVDRNHVLVGTLARRDLPPGMQRATRSLQRRRDVVEAREKHGQGVASTIQPGGLDVYTDRLTIKVPPD
jgi:CBS domain-containing protein